MALGGRIFLPELLAGLEEGHFLDGNLDRIAGSGIAPLSGIAEAGTKFPKLRSATLPLTRKASASTLT